MGSGKTTPIDRIIQNFEGYKVAVLVNEFGNINIDSQLLVEVGNDDDNKNTIELTNGCICCTINDDFADAVYRILTRRDRVDYLVIETTGVANLLPIAMTFLGTELRDFTHLDSIVTVVDAEALAFSHDGKWLAAGGLDGNITLWRIDREIPELFDTIESGSCVYRLVWSPTCNHLAFNLGIPQAVG